MQEITKWFLTKTSPLARLNPRLTTHTSPSASPEVECIPQFNKPITIFNLSNSNMHSHAEHGNEYVRFLIFSLETSLSSLHQTL